MSTTDESKRSIWGPELWMTILLTPLTIAAIVFTIYIAQQNRFTPSETIQTSRFGEVQTPPETDSADATMVEPLMVEEPPQ